MLVHRFKTWLMRASLQTLSSIFFKLHRDKEQAGVGDGNMHANILDPDTHNLDSFLHPNVVSEHGIWGKCFSLLLKFDSSSSCLINARFYHTSRQMVSESFTNWQWNTNDCMSGNSC